MSAPTRQVAPANDPIGEALHLIKITGTFYCRSELYGDWGVALPPLEHCMMIHIVTVGSCYLEIDGMAPRQVRQGDLVLVPHGAGHKICSEPGQQSQYLFDIPVHKISERYEVMHLGEQHCSAPYTQLMCVGLRFDHVIGQQLITQLPKLLHIDTWASDDGRWLQSMLSFMATEAKSLKPGGETVLTHLADILVIQAIRYWIESLAEHKQGWLAGLKDRQIGRALLAIHQDPKNSWSVIRLAERVGMSRSAFSARFSEIIGVPVMQYVKHWRLQRARLQLQEGRASIFTVAQDNGYQSEAAFSRAFKRQFGLPPGALRNEKSEF